MLAYIQFYEPQNVSEKNSIKAKYLKFKYYYIVYF